MPAAVAPPGGSQDGNFDFLFGARNFDLTPTGIWGPFYRSEHQFSRLEVDPQPERKICYSQSSNGSGIWRKRPQCLWVTAYKIPQEGQETIWGTMCNFVRNGLRYGL